jgi:hypothetical protein
MIEHLPELVNNDPILIRRGRFLSDTFMLEVGDQQYLIRISAGRIEAIDKGPFVMRSWTFAIRAPQETWARFWQRIPDPGYHDIFALLRKAEIVFEGNLQPLMANLLYIKLLLAAPRSLTGEA